MHRETDKPNRQGDWTSVKLHRDFARWLKIQAVTRDVFMGDLLEEFASSALGGGKPWRKKKVSA